MLSTWHANAIPTNRAARRLTRSRVSKHAHTAHIHAHAAAAQPPTRTQPRSRGPRQARPALKVARCGACSDPMRGRRCASKDALPGAAHGPHSGPRAALHTPSDVCFTVAARSRAHIAHHVIPINRAARRLTQGADLLNSRLPALSQIGENLTTGYRCRVCERPSAPTADRSGTALPL